MRESRTTDHYAGQWDFRSGNARTTQQLRDPSHARIFVCQGGGKAVAVLYGAAVKCGCGTTSSAEVML